MEEPPSLRNLKRFITDHASDGKAVFSKQVEENLIFKDDHHLPPEGDKSLKIALGYATDEFPANLGGQRDVTTYQRYLDNAPGFTIHNGTVFRFLDLPPGIHLPMHRTKSLDYAVVIEGTVKAGLDSGEERILHPGDSLIQRGTNHDWRNVSQTHWARMLFVLLDAQPEWKSSA